MWVSHKCHLGISTRNGSVKNVTWKFRYLDGNLDIGLDVDISFGIKQEGFLGSSFPLRKFEKSVEDPKDCESLNHKSLIGLDRQMDYEILCLEVRDLRGRIVEKQSIKVTCRNVNMSNVN